MKTTAMGRHSSNRAVEALELLLQQVSSIRLIEIRRARPGSRRADTEAIVAEVEVYGHSRLLVCAIDSCDDAVEVRAAIEALRQCAERTSADATPVLIAASPSAEAQALCSELKAGYLDLDGNARLELGEFFIARHLNRQRAVSRFDRPVIENADRALMGAVAPVHVEIHSSLSVAALPFS
jgi:hypothetical protein